MEGISKDMNAQQYYKKLILIEFFKHDCDKSFLKAAREFLDLTHYFNDNSSDVSEVESPTYDEAPSDSLILEIQAGLYAKKITSLIFAEKSDISTEPSESEKTIQNDKSCSDMSLCSDSDDMDVTTKLSNLSWTSNETEQVIKNSLIKYRTSQISSSK